MYQPETLPLTNPFGLVTPCALGTDAGLQVLAQPGQPSKVLFQKLKSIKRAGDLAQRPCVLPLLLQRKKMYSLNVVQHCLELHLSILRGKKNDRLLLSSRVHSIKPELLGAIPAPANSQPGVSSLKVGLPEDLELLCVRPDVEVRAQ